MCTADLHLWSQDIYMPLMEKACVNSKLRIDKNSGRNKINIPQPHMGIAPSKSSIM